MRYCTEEHRCFLIFKINMLVFIMVQDTIPRQKIFGHFKLALQEHREVLGDDHQDILRTMTRLAAAYADLAQHEKAKTLLVHVLDKQRQILENDHPDTLKSINTPPKFPQVSAT